MKKYILPVAALAFIFALDSCKKDDKTVTPTTQTYTISTTYDYANANYSNQAKLLLMADQIVATVNLANTSGHVVTAQTLTDMFNNVGGLFNDSSLQLNNSGLKLSDYCSAAQKADMLSDFDKIGTYSQSNAAASEGAAGVAVSLGNKKSLLSPNGIFYSQVIKKTIMGICAYQITSVYLVDSISNTVNNTNVVSGNGTTMEHAWDQAFGFFGVPVNFPTTTTGSKYFGSYSNQVDPGLHSNTTIMNAFLKGRAAITNKDMTTKQEQADIIINTFDQLAAACVVQEMKETDVNIAAGDTVAAYGTLSETLGFIRCLKYNTSAKRVITNDQILELEKLFDSANPENPNLYQFLGGLTLAQQKAKTDAIRQYIGNIYKFGADQLSLL